MPGLQPGPWGSGECLGQRGDNYLEAVLNGVGLGDDAAQPGLRLLVISSVGEQHGRVGSEQKACVLLLEGLEPSHKCLGVVAQRGAGGVATGQVLGPHDRAVRRSPQKAGLVDGRRDAAPHDSVGEAGLLQKLGHLADVTEHVREVADLHRPPELGRALEPELKIAHDRLAGDEEFLHEHVPRAESDPP